MKTTTNPDLEELSDFSKAQNRVNTLIKDWDKEEQETVKRRRQRDIDIDIKKLRASGRLRNDETLINVRVINANIKREQPALAAYLLQSRRLAIFKNQNSLEHDITQISQIEEAFTQGLQYVGWSEAYFKAIDGAQTHGWDAVEVEFDDTKPLKVNVAHIGHENLIFDLKAKRLEACEQILVKYELSLLQLKTFRDEFEFNSEAIKELEERMKNSNKEGDLTKVYKRFFKFKGTVYVSWYSQEVQDKWLKDPAPLWLGRVTKKQVSTTQMVPTLDPTTGQMIDVPTPVMQEVTEKVYESIYPVKLYIYDLTESSTIADCKGRCYYDGPKQEAQTALWSIFVNGSVRAGNVFASPRETSPEKTGIPKKLPTQLEYGCIYDQAFDFWSPPYPDASLVRAAGSLETQNQAENGNIAFSVVNRDDSRKTAKELTMAQDQSNLLSSIQVALESNWLRQVLSHAWLIVQSFAAQNLITFLPLPEGGNDLAVINKAYDIFPAGDIDVVKREEKLQRRGQMWPIVLQTPLATSFLIDMIKEAFPDDAKKYQEILVTAQQQAAQENQQMLGMKQIISAMAMDDNGMMKEEFKPYEKQIQQVLNNQ